MENFFTNFTCVAENVGILFLLMAAGFISNKTRLLHNDGAKCLSDIVLYIVNPCKIVASFIRDYDPEMLGRYLLTFLASLVTHAALAVCVYLFIHDKEMEKERVYRFAVMFSNAGYMAFPLQQAILGQDGIFFGSAYVAGFNVFMWTLGVLIMSGDKKQLSVKKLAATPGLLSIALGMVIFILSVPVPSAVTGALNHLSNLNTPIPMIVIGYHLANTNFIAALKDKKSYYCMFLRLILFPVIGIAAVWLCGFRGTEFIALSVAMSTPAAAATTMFASKYDLDVGLSANLVSVSTLVSIATMPVLVALAMNFA